MGLKLIAIKKNLKKYGKDLRNFIILLNFASLFTKP